MDDLTNENLKPMSKSSFNLAHAAIKLGQDMIASGKNPTVKDVLKELKKHPEYCVQEDQSEQEESFS